MYTSDKGESMKYICASHGCMASGVKNTIEMFLGEQNNIYAIDAYTERHDFVQEFLKLVSSFKIQERIIVFTDVFSGSVNQTIIRYLNDFDMIVITGFNLPLIMEIIMRQEDLDNEEINKIIKQAKEQIIYVNPLVNEQKENCIR